jgi:hypothetical protein
MDGRGGLVDEGCRFFRDCYPQSAKNAGGEPCHPISEFDVSTLKMMACLGCADRRYTRCSSDRLYDIKTTREFTCDYSVLA